MKRLLMFAVLILTLPIAIWAQQAPLAKSNGAWIDLGKLPNGAWSYATAVSAKGEVVAGSSDTSGDGRMRAFRWTAASGITDLGGDSGAQTLAYSISGDGTVIGGTYGHYPECNPYCSFRWSAGNFDFPPNADGWYDFTPAGLSQDGSVMAAGASKYGAYVTGAFTWTPAAGYVQLPDLPNADGGSWAYGLSSDGTVAVGQSAILGAIHAVSWKNGVITDLGMLPGAYNTVAYAASKNGSIIVGDGATTNCPPGGTLCTEGFRWTKKNGMVQLQPPPEWDASIFVTGISADGKTMIGWASSQAFCCGWRWTQATGYQTINQWLEAVGVDASNVTFYRAYAVSSDGSAVVGQLTNGDAFLALATSNKTGAPTFSPKPGKYLGSVTVTLSHTSPQASIYYTTDGSTPTKNSTPYTAPILVTVSTTIKAIAIVPSYPQSAVATGKYTIK